MRNRNWLGRAARKIFGIGEGDKTALVQAVRSSTAMLSEADAIKKFRHFVYTCAMRNGSAVASVPLRLYARGPVTDQTKRYYGMRGVPRARMKHIVAKGGATEGEEIVELTDHPVLDVLRLANPREIGFSLKELTTIYQELTGNSYWYLEPWGDLVRGAQPKAIWNLMPQHMTPVPAKDGRAVKGYIYGTSPQDRIAFKPEEIIHFRYPNPESTVKGLGPAQAATAALHRKDAMDEYKRAMYDNDAKPPFLLKVPEATTDEQIRSLERQWTHLFKSRRGGGVNIQGKPLIATSDKSIEMLSYPPSQMQDIPQARLDRDEIYEDFGNPPQMAEIGKSRAELDAAMTGYMWFTILPRLRRMEQVLTETLAVLYDDRLFFAFDDPVPENREATLKEVEVLVGKKIITRNEARQLAGFDELEEGGDEFIAAAPAPGGLGGGAALSAAPFRPSAQSPFGAADDA